MKKFVCDKCLREVDDDSALSTFCFDKLDFYCDDLESRKHTHKDLCGNCGNEIGELKKQILFENKQRLLDWFKTKPKKND